MATTGHESETINVGGLKSSLQALKTKYVDSMNSDISSLDSRVDTLEEAVGSGGSIDSRIENAINDLDASISQTAGTDGLALSITETDGIITTISGSIASDTYAPASDSARITTLENNVGSGSVNTRISTAVAAESSRAENVESSLSNRIGTVEGNVSSLSGRVTTAEGNISTNTTNISNLQSLYNGLTQSDIIVGALPASGTKNKIYRVPGTSEYSDYMWNGSSFVKMATYSDYDFSSMAEIKDSLKNWKLQDGILKGYINANSIFVAGNGWRTFYIKVEEGDLIEFTGYVGGNYRSGYTDNVPTESGFTLSTTIPQDTTSPYIATRSGYFCISNYWNGSNTVQLKAKVLYKDIWDKFPKILEDEPTVITGYVRKSDCYFHNYGVTGFYTDFYLLTAGKEYIVYCNPNVEHGIGGDGYFFGVSLSYSIPTGNGEFAFENYPLVNGETIKLFPSVNVYLAINQGYNEAGRDLFKVFTDESFADAGLEISNIKEQLNGSVGYRGKSCIYIGDSISTNNNYKWKGLIESQYGLKWVRNSSGQLAPADGGITLRPSQTEPSDLSRKSIWYRCAASRMSIYSFDVISIMGGVNDMTNSSLPIGTIDDKPYVDNASSFSDPSSVTDTWTDNITAAQALMGCIEMLKRDFPSKEIIICTVIPCSSPYGNWTDSATGLIGSEALAEMQVKVANKYNLKVAPMYWSQRTPGNAGRKVFATDGVHPNLAFATVMKTIFAESLGII